MWMFWEIVGSFSDVRIQNIGSWGDGGCTYDGCGGKTTYESTNDITTQPIGIFLLFFCISVSHGQKELWGWWWEEHIWLLWQKHKLVRTQTSKCNQWVDSYLFCTKFVQQDRRTAPPPVWRDRELCWGARMGAHPIPDGGEGRTRRWWDVAILWLLKGISPFFMVSVLDELVKVCCWDLCH